MIEGDGHATRFGPPTSRKFRGLFGSFRVCVTSERGLRTSSIRTRFQLLIIRHSCMPHYLPGLMLQAMPWLVSNKVFENSLRTLRPADVSAVHEAPST